MGNSYRAKKHFGQNFLHDMQIIDNIIRAIRPQAKQTLIEIGPGLGAITKELLAHLDALTVIELDGEVIPRLQRYCGVSEKLTVIHSDVLKVDFKQFASNEVRIVGNLPYNISTPILFHLLGFIDVITDMHFMLQREVVDRIAAAPNNKTYGRLSVILQYFFDVEKLFDVPPEAFDPKPKVYSAILRLVPKKERALSKAQEEGFIALVRQAFSQRRKTLRNTLKGIVSAQEWERVGIDPGLRAEALSVEDFVKLARR